MQTKMFNPMIKRVGLKQIMPVISPRYAAKQILDAIEWNRDEIILPYHLKYVAFINQYLLPRRLSRWFIYYISGRKPLDEFTRENEETIREKKRKHMNTLHKENIDLI